MPETRSVLRKLQATLDEGKQLSHKDLAKYKRLCSDAIWRDSVSREYKLLESCVYTPCMKKKKRLSKLCILESIERQIIDLEEKVVSKLKEHCRSAENDHQGMIDDNFEQGSLHEWFLSVLERYKYFRGLTETEKAQLLLKEQKENEIDTVPIWPWEKKGMKKTESTYGFLCNFMEDTHEPDIREKEVFNDDCEVPSTIPDSEVVPITALESSNYFQLAEESTKTPKRGQSKRGRKKIRVTDNDLEKVKKKRGRKPKCKSSREETKKLDNGPSIHERPVRRRKQPRPACCKQLEFENDIGIDSPTISEECFNFDFLAKEDGSFKSSTDNSLLTSALKNYSGFSDNLEQLNSSETQLNSIENQLLAQNDIMMVQDENVGFKKEEGRDESPNFQWYERNHMDMGDLILQWSENLMKQSSCSTEFKASASGYSRNNVNTKSSSIHKNIVSTQNTPLLKRKRKISDFHTRTPPPTRTHCDFRTEYSSGPQMKTTDEHIKHFPFLSKNKKYEETLLSPLKNLSRLSVSSSEKHKIQKSVDLNSFKLTDKRYKNILDESAFKTPKKIEPGLKQFKFKQEPNDGVDYNNSVKFSDLGRENTIKSFPQSPENVTKETMSLDSNFNELKDFQFGLTTGELCYQSPVFSDSFLNKTIKEEPLDEWYDFSVDSDINFSSVSAIKPKQENDNDIPVGFPCGLDEFIDLSIFDSPVIKKEPLSTDISDSPTTRSFNLAEKVFISNELAAFLDSVPLEGRSSLSPVGSGRNDHLLSYTEDTDRSVHQDYTASFTPGFDMNFPLKEEPPWF